MSILELNIKEKINNLIRTEIFKEVSQTIITRFSLIFFGLVYGVIVTRSLGPEGRGEFGVAMSFIAIATNFCLLGFNMSNTYFVSKDRSKLEPILGNSIVLSFGLCTLLMFLLWVFFNFQTQLAPLNMFFMVFVLIAVPFNVFYYFGQSIVLGIQDISFYNKMQLVSSVTAIAFIILLILFNLISAMNMIIVQVITLVLLFFLVVYKLKKKIVNKISVSVDLMKKSISYGSKSYFATLFFTSIIEVDILMVNYMLDKEQTGLYAVAIGLLNLVMIFPAVTGQILFPKLCAMDKWKEKIQFAFKTALVIAALLILILLVSFVLVDDVINILYGNVFVAASIPFYFFIPGLFIVGVESIMRKLLVSEGFRMEVLFAWTFAFFLNLVLNYFLIDKYGINGAAIATSIAYASVSLFTLPIVVQLWRKHNV